MPSSPRRLRPRTPFRPALEPLDRRDLPAVSILTPLGNVSAVPGVVFTGALAVFQDSNITSPAAVLHLHAAINWGDGQVSAGTISGPDTGGNFTVTGTNTFAAAQLYPVTVSVRDDLDGSTAATFTLVSANGLSFPGGVTSPTPDGTLQLSPVSVNALAGQVFSGVVAVVHDSANPPAGHLAAVVDWGDGTGFQVLAVAQVAPGVFDVLGSHFYPVAGSGTVGIAVQDVTNGQTASATAPLVVTDSAPAAPAPAPPPAPAQPTPAAQPNPGNPHVVGTDNTFVSGYWGPRRGHPHQIVWHPAQVFRHWAAYFRV
jgi:hypothetical protein